METNKKPSNPDLYKPTKGMIEDRVTLRDYFANSAMQAHLNNFELYKGVAKAYNCNSDKSIYNAIAKEAYQIADAMLKKREL